MFSDLKLTISNNLLNITGWNTNRKIIVIESDDWGSIRMPSSDIYRSFVDNGIPLDKCPYNRFDSLASEDDLADLFNVLVEFRDFKNNHPVITANTVVTNPDFEKIKNSDFQEFYSEPFTKTLERYPAHKNSFKIWKEGMNSGVFHPQFHGREHVNINLWKNLLQNSHPVFVDAFNHEFWGIGPTVLKINEKINIQATFDALNYSEIESQKIQIIEGLKLFKDIFGYNSESFIANNFIWHPNLNKTLKDNGVDTIQGMKYQLLPKLNNKKRKKIRHYTGQKNEYNQIYLIRNCDFEPSQNLNSDSVNNCLNQISTAFMWKKPAIISTHRLNFIGFLVRENKENTLKLFSELLRKILKKWPDVEFMTSDQLGKIIRLENK